MAKTSKVSVYVLRRPAHRSRLSYTWKLGGNPTWAGSTTESTRISVGSRCSNSQETTALSPHSLKDDAGKPVEPVDPSRLIQSRTDGTPLAADSAHSASEGVC